jgi:mono/diheme cytochrome c family protein
MSHRRQPPLVAAAAAVASLACGASALAQPKPQAKWEAPAEAKQLQNPVKTDGRTVERGSQLFHLHCVGCHGDSGVGDGRMGKVLGYKPADLTLEKLAQQTDGEIFWKISKGREPMPTWEKQLNARERWDLVSYIRTLLKPSK